MKPTKVIKALESGEFEQTEGRLAEESGEGKKILLPRGRLRALPEGNRKASEPKAG